MEQSKRASLSVARSILNHKLIGKKLESYLKVCLVPNNGLGNTLSTCVRVPSSGTSANKKATPNFFDLVP